MVAKDFREKAREALRGRWKSVIVITLVASLLGGWINNGTESWKLITKREKYFMFLDLPQEVIALITGILIFIVIWGLIMFLIGAPIEIGYCRFLLSMLKGKETSIKDIFSAYNIFWRTLAMRLLRRIYIFLWALLLIIPGIVAEYSYAVAPFIMAENPDIGPDEAIGRSKHMMHGNRWRLFCLEFSFIGWKLLSLLTLGIGRLWIAPYEATAKAVFYNQLLEEQREI